jgi:hypothetical protein
MRIRLPAVAALVAAALASSASVGVVPAQADGVAEAQARVARLQQVQQEATRRLLDGTAKWEADQRALHATRLAVRNTRRHIREQEAVLAAQQRKVGIVARSLYMDPVPHGVQLALTRTPDQVLESLKARSALDMAEGSRAAVIQSVVQARHRLAVKEAEVVALERRSADLVARSARRMTELRSLARSVATQLESAQAALTRAREAAAAAAARRRAALERAARSRAAAGTACTGSSTAGQQNGNLDPASLCPLWRAPGHRLRADAAAAFNKMSKYHAAVTGSPLCVTDSYRSYSEQVAVYESKPGLAAVPGTREHGWGQAVDFCGGVERAGSPAYDWMKANAGRFGWFHPDWAEPSGSRPEAWHWEFAG